MANETKFVVNFELLGKEDLAAWIQFIQNPGETGKLLQNVKVGDEFKPLADSAAKAGAATEDMNTKLTDAQIKKQAAGDAAAALALKINTLATETLNYTKENADASAGLSTFILKNGLTQEAIEGTIQKLMNENKTLAFGSDQYNKNSTAIANLRNSYNYISGGSQQLVGQSNAARMAMMGFNYTLQDSGMFFVNFRMGMMSISNNIPWLIQGLAGMREEARKNEVSFASMLKTAFTGPNAMLAIGSAVNFAMMALPIIFDKINESSKKAAEDGLKKFNAALKDMSEESVNINLKIKQSELDALQAAKENILKHSPDALKYSIIFGIDATGFDTQIKTLKEEITALQDKANITTEQRKKRQGELEADIKNYKDLAASVNKDQVDADKIIHNYDNLRVAKEKELQGLMMSDDDLAKKKQQDADAAAAKEKKQLEEKQRAYEKLIVAKLQLGEKIDISDAFAKLGGEPEILDKLLEASQASWTEKVNELKQIIAQTKDLKVVADAEKQITQIEKLERDTEHEIAKLKSDLNDSEKDKELARIKEEYDNDIEKHKETIKDKDQLNQWLHERELKFIKDKADTERQYLQLPVGYQDIPKGMKNSVENPKFGEGALEGIIPPEDELAYRFNAFNALVSSSADVLTSEFDSAWQKVFGEANTVIEKIGMRFMKMLTDEALKAAIKSLFQNSDNNLAANANGAETGISVLDTIASVITSVFSFLDDGAVVTRPTLAVLGEKNKKEAVIPLEKAHGQAALRQILQSQSLNMSVQPSYSSMAAFASPDYSGLEKMLEKKFTGLEASFREKQFEIIGNNIRTVNNRSTTLHTKWIL